MRSDRTAALLWDASRAIERTQRFVSNWTFDDYLDDDMVRSAVERQLEIGGEALAAIRRNDPLIAGKIVNLQKIVGFRNILVHGYATVDHTVIWDVVQSHLPSPVSAD